VTIGSTAITNRAPGGNRRPAELLADEVGHLGILVHLTTDAVTHEGFDQENLCRLT